MANDSKIVLSLLNFTDPRLFVMFIALHSATDFKLIVLKKLKQVNQAPVQRIEIDCLF